MGVVHGTGGLSAGHAKSYYREQLAQGDAEVAPWLRQDVAAATAAVDAALAEEARPDWVRAGRPSPTDPDSPNLLPVGRPPESLTPGEAVALAELRQITAHLQAHGVYLGIGSAQPGQSSGPSVRIGGEEVLRLAPDGILYEQSRGFETRRWWIPATPETLAAFSSRIQVLYPEFDPEARNLPVPQSGEPRDALAPLLTRLQASSPLAEPGVLAESGLTGFAVPLGDGRELIFQPGAALVLQAAADSSSASFGALEVRRLELAPSELGGVLADAQLRGLAPVFRTPGSPPPFVPGESTGLVLDSGEGLWTGKLAARLGLSSDEPIEAGAFENLAEGQSPDGARTLAQPARGETPETRRAGFDYVFAPDKSVSVQALLGEDSRILEAHRRAVLTALAAMERDAGTESRRAFVATGEFLVARFDHGFSRALDPQLHTHAFVLNLTRRGRGYGPLNPLLIRQHVRHYEQLYSAQLASELRALGYRVEIAPQTLVARLADVPESVARAFSSRATKITATQAERMRTAGLDPSRTTPRTRQQLRDHAVLTTREAKPGRIRWEALIPQWQQKGRQLGFDALSLSRAARERSLALDPDRRGTLVVTGEDPSEPAPLRAEATAWLAVESADHIVLPSGTGLRAKAARAVEHPSFLDRVATHVSSLARSEGRGQALLVVADPARGTLAVRSPEQFAASAPATGILLASITQPPHGILLEAHARQIQADALTALAASHPGAFMDEARQTPGLDTRGVAPAPPPGTQGAGSSPLPSSPASPDERRPLPPTATASVEYAVARLAERNAVFSRGELQRTALIRLLRVSGLRQDEAIRATTRAVDAAIARRLYGLLPHSKDHLTTQGARAAETDNYSLMTQLMARPRAIAPATARDLGSLRRWYQEQQAASPEPAALKNLTDQQLLALGQALRGASSIAMLEAGPGAGKSRSLEALQTLARREGWTVRFFAPTRRAVESLGEYGVGAETVQGFIRRPLPKDLASQELWILDEVGQTGQEDWNRFARMALHAGAKVYAVGDRQQHHAVPAGSIPQQLSAFGVPIYRIQELNRQHAPDPTSRRAPADANALRVAAFATHQRPGRALSELRATARTDSALVTRRRELFALVAARGIERTREALCALPELGSAEVAKKREKLTGRLEDYRSLARPDTAARNLIVVQDPYVQREAVAALYLANPPERRDESLVVFPTHAARDEFAGIVRELRLGPLGELDPRRGQISLLRLRDLSWTAADSGDISAYLRANNSRDPHPLFLHFPTGHGDLRLRRDSYVEVRRADSNTASVTLALPDGTEATVSVRELSGQVSALEMSKLTLVVGDRVQFRKTERAESINNGDLATLVEVRPDPASASEQIAVFELDRRRAHGEPIRVQLSSQHLNTFDFGYSVTSHSAQSITKDEVLAAYHTGEQAQVLSSANPTVDLTRSRYHVAVVTDDPQQLATLFEAPHLRPMALAASSSSGAAAAPLANGIVRDEGRARAATEQLIASLAAHARPLDAMDQETPGLSHLAYQAWTRFEQASEAEQRLRAWTTLAEALRGQYTSVHRDRTDDLRRLPSPVVSAFASWQMERSGVPSRYLLNTESTLAFAREIHRELRATVPPGLTRTEHQRRLLYGSINLENVEAAAVAGDLPRYMESVDTVRQMLALDIPALDRPEESKELLLGRLEALETTDTRLRAEWIAATLSPTVALTPEDLRYVRLERSLHQDDPPPDGSDPWPTRGTGHGNPGGSAGGSSGPPPTHPGSGGGDAGSPGGDRPGTREAADDLRELDRRPGYRRSPPPEDRRADREADDGLRVARASGRDAAVALGAARQGGRGDTDDDLGVLEAARARAGRSEQGAPAPDAPAQGGQRAQAGSQDRSGAEQEVLGGVRGGGAAAADPGDGRGLARRLVRGGELQEGAAGAAAGNRPGDERSAGAGPLTEPAPSPPDFSPTAGVPSMSEPSSPSNSEARSLSRRVYAPDAVDQVRRLLDSGGFKPTGPSHQFQAFCPGHKDGAKSGRRSLSIGTGGDGKPLFHCYAGCSHQRVLGALGVSYDTFKIDGPSFEIRRSEPSRHEVERSPVAWTPMKAWPDPYKLRHPTFGAPQHVWAIRDRDGNLFAYKARWDKDAPGNDTGTKQVRWFRGGWSLNRRETPEAEKLHAADAPLYRSEVAFDPDRPVFLVEGEKAADALAALGLQVYGTHSASNRPQQRNLEFLRGASVLIWPDKDEAGARQAAAVGGALGSIVSKVSIATAPAWLAPKGDAADYVERLASEGLDPRAIRFRLRDELELRSESEPTRRSAHETFPQGAVGAPLASLAEPAAPPAAPSESHSVPSTTLRSPDEPTDPRFQAASNLGGVPRPEAPGAASEARSDRPDGRPRAVPGLGLPAAVFVSPDGVPLPVPGRPSYRGQAVADDLSVDGRRRGLVAGINFTQHRELAEQFAASPGPRSKEVAELEVSIARPFSLLHGYPADYLATLDPAAVALARERGDLLAGDRIAGASFLDAAGAAFARSRPGFDLDNDDHRAEAMMAVRDRLLAGGYDSTYSVQGGQHIWAALNARQVRRIDSPARAREEPAPGATAKTREGEAPPPGRSPVAARMADAPDVLDLTEFDAALPAAPASARSTVAPVERSATSAGLVVDDARQALAGRRVLVVGDVHGELETLKRALERLEFRPDRGDVLVSVGDLIDRGPESKQVLDYVQSLGESFLGVRGNHEQRLLALHGREKEGMFLGSDLAATFESFGAESGSRTVPESYLDFLGRLPHALRLPQGLVVHAGLSPGRSFEDQEPQTVLSIRNVARADGAKVPWWQAGEPPVPERVFFGHTPIESGAAPETDRLIALDGGATHGDQLRLWDSGDGRVHAFAVAELAPERARQAAPPPEPSALPAVEQQAPSPGSPGEPPGGSGASRPPQPPEPPRVPPIPHLMTEAARVQAESPELFARFARETEYLERYGKSREAFVQNAEAVLKSQKIEGSHRPTSDPEVAIARSLAELSERSPAFAFDEVLTRAWVHTGGSVALEALDEHLHRRTDVVFSPDGSRLARVDSYAEELYVAAQIARGRDVEPIVPASARPQELETRLRSAIADPADRAAMAEVLENRHQFSFVTSRDGGAQASAATSFAVGLHRELARRGWHPVHVTSGFEQRGELLEAGIPAGQIASRRYFLEGGGWAFGTGRVAPVAIVHGAERLAVHELRGLVDRAHAGGLRVVFAARHPELSPFAARGPALLAAAAGERLIPASERRYAGSALAALWRRPTANDPGGPVSAALSAALAGSTSRVRVVEVDSDREVRAASAALAAPGPAPALLVTNVSLDADRAAQVLAERTDTVRAHLHRAGRLNLDEQVRVEVREKVPALSPETVRAEHWRPGDWLYRREPGGSMSAFRLVAVDRQGQKLAAAPSGQRIDGNAVRIERITPAEAAHMVTYRSAERSFAQGDFVRFRSEPGGPLASGRIAGFDPRGGIRIEGGPKDGPTPVLELDHHYVAHARSGEHLALAEGRAIVVEIDGPRYAGQIQRLLAGTPNEQVEQILGKSERDLAVVLDRPQNLGSQLALAVVHQAREPELGLGSPAAVRQAPEAPGGAAQPPRPPQERLDPVGLAAPAPGRTAAALGVHAPGAAPLTPALALPCSWEAARDEILRLSSRIVEMEQVREQLERSGKDLAREQSRSLDARPATEAAERFEKRLGELRAEGASFDLEAAEAARAARRHPAEAYAPAAVAAARTARILTTAQIALHAAERLLDDDPERLTRSAVATAKSTSLSVTRSALGALARDRSVALQPGVTRDAPSPARAPTLPGAGGPGAALPRPSTGGKASGAGDKSPVSTAANAALSALNFTQTSRRVQGALERLSQGQAREIVRLASLVAREGVQKAMTFVAPQVKPFVSAALAAGRTAAAAARAIAAPSKGLSR